MFTGHDLRRALSAYLTGGDVAELLVVLAGAALVVPQLRARPAGADGVLLPVPRRQRPPSSINVRQQRVPFIPAPRSR
jgi:hypothetical protein